MTRAYCSVVTRSHLRLAAATQRSLRVAGNDEPYHLLVPDAVSVEELPAPEPGQHYHLLAEFDDELPALIRYYFDAFELCNALKPFLIRRLLCDGTNQVAYLDVDLFVVSSFTPLWGQLVHHHVLLTPHLLSPPQLNSRAVNEIEVMDQGIFNGGFSGWARSPATCRILDWMCERFVIYGFNDRPKGMFVDQKLLPFLPEYFPKDVTVWRTPTANIAFWNAHERPVICRAGRYEIVDQPVLFFHLSGYRSATPNLPCSYLPEAANGQILDQAPWLLQVLRDYQALLDSLPPTSLPPLYPYNTYDDFNLNPALRRILFEKGSLARSDPRVQRAIWIERLKRLKRWLLARL